MSVIKRYNGSTWELIGGGGGNGIKAETTVSGSAVTSVTFTGLDGNTDGGYILNISLVHGSTNDGLIYLFANGDTTTTNYYSTAINHYHTYVLSNSDNKARCAYVGASQKVTIYIDISCEHLRFGWISRHIYEDTTQPHLFEFAGVKTADITNLTSLTITAGANSIQVGSIFRLYKRK